MDVLDRLERSAFMDAVAILRNALADAEPEIRILRARIRRACASGDGLAESPELVRELDAGVQRLERDLTEDLSEQQRQAQKMANDEFDAEMARAYTNPPGNFRPIVYRCPQLASGQLEPLPNGSSPRRLLSALGPDFRTDAAKEIAGLVADCATLDDIRKAMRTSLARTATRARTVLRHESRRAYRENMKCLMERNEHLVRGWVWVSRLDARTCVICWSMHGTVHPRNQGQDAHVNCRCRMVPVWRTWRELGYDRPGPEPDYDSGEELFAELPEEDQRRILGSEDYGSYVDGDVKLSDLVGRRRSRIWGYSRYRRRP